MEARTRVFLSGNSVVVGSVGASLERVRQFEVLRSATLSPDPTELEALAPDVAHRSLHSSSVSTLRAAPREPIRGSNRNTTRWGFVFSGGQPLGNL